MQNEVARPWNGMEVWICSASAGPAGRSPGGQVKRGRPASLSCALGQANGVALLRVVGLSSYSGPVSFVWARIQTPLFFIVYIFKRKNRKTPCNSTAAAGLLAVAGGPINAIRGIVANSPT